MRAALLLLAAAPALAHMVSISTGDITIQGTRGSYEFRMPLYEIAHVEKPEQALRTAIRFFAWGNEAKQTKFECRNDAGENAMICKAEQGAKSGGQADRQQADRSGLLNGQTEPEDQQRHTNDATAGAGQGKDQPDDGTEQRGHDCRIDRHRHRQLRSC